MIIPPNNSLYQPPQPKPIYVPGQHMPIFPGMRGWEEAMKLSRIGTPGSMGGGMNSMSGVDAGLYGPNGVVVPTPPVAGYNLYTFANAGVFQSNAGTTPATANNDVIGYWTDQSGSGNHLKSSADDSTRPTLQLNQQNTYACVRFDGSNDILAATFAQAQPFTIFIVVKPIAYATPSAHGFYSNTGSGAGGDYPLLYPFSTTGIGALPYSSREDDFGSLSTLTAQYQAVGFRWKTGDGYFSYRSVGTTVTGTGGGVGVVTLTGLRIGTGTGSQGPINCDYLSVLAYPSGLSNADVDTVRDWYATTVFAF